MLEMTKRTKADPIFAAIEAHRQATAARYPIPGIDGQHARRRT
jgi:hypothetical protein